jgi:hypothetical protein
LRAAVRPAGGAWSPPAEIDPGGTLFRAPIPLIDAAGNATVAWSSGYQKDSVAPRARQAVRVAERPMAGAWSAPTVLSAPGSAAVGPSVANNAAGDTIVSWITEGDPADPGAAGAGLVQAAIRRAGRQFGAPIDVSVPGHRGAAPGAAIDAAGTTLVVWEDMFTNAMVSATRLPGGAFSVPQVLRARGCVCDFASPQVRINERGDAVVAFQFSRNGIEEYSSDILAVTRTAAGRFGEPALLTEPSPVDSGPEPNRAPRAAIDAAGRSIVVWSGERGVHAVGLDPASGAFPLAALFTGLRISPKRFRAARSGPAATSLDTGHGARVTVTLKATAYVHFTIRRVVPGRRAGRRCVKSDTITGRTRCTRYLRKPGELIRRAQAGITSFTFNGRVNSPLRPGRYQLRATTTSSSRTTTRNTTFRITR